jgi:hypothetical protein
VGLICAIVLIARSPIIGFCIYAEAAEAAAITKTTTHLITIGMLQSPVGTWGERGTSNLNIQ